jgi:hypothetical protein
MVGVDRVDQYCSSYAFLKKCVKSRENYISGFWRFHLSDMGQHSANLPTLYHLEFHKKMIEELVGNVWNKMY